MIRLGPGGNCDSTTEKSIEKLPKIGLNAQEIEFVYGVTLGNEQAKKIGELAKKNKISLSVHAPYYINLVSKEKAKVHASKNRILQSCERAHHLNAKYVVFHPGFFQGKDEKIVFEDIYNELKDIKDKIKEKKWDVTLAPETTGKHSAFGSLQETIELAKKLKSGLCVDFAHLYARNNGKINYSEVFDELKQLHLTEIHSHFSSINYSEKGELNHLNISENKPNFKKLAEEILKRKLNITIICESPRQYLDSIDMRKIFESLNYKF